MKKNQTSTTNQNSSTTRELEEILSSLAAGDLIIVIGSGVSVAMSDGVLPNWPNLIKLGLSHCQKKGIINEAQHNRWTSTLQSDDIDELLGTAEFMARKLDAPRSDIYARWLKEVFQKIAPKNQAWETAVKNLHNAGIPICTLNYDSLLEIATGLPPILMDDTVGITEWVRRERQGIAHIHGFWEVPESCILSIRDYQSTIGNDSRDRLCCANQARPA